MAMDFIGLSVGMGYTDETVIGGGALKGKNCVVSNIEEVADGVNVTFQWTLDDGTVKTDTAFIPKGTQGDAELLDARTDYTGKTWDNVGSHIRGISSQLSSDIDKVNDDMSNQVIPISKESGKYIFKDGGKVEGEWWDIYKFKVNDFEKIRFEFCLVESAGWCFKDIHGNVIGGSDSVTYNGDSDIHIGYILNIPKNAYTIEISNHKYTLENPIAYYNVNSTLFKLAKKECLPSLAVFEKIGIIGDSYASGEICNKNTEEHEPMGDFYNLSWGQIIGRKNGISVVNFSEGGLSTESWFNSDKGYSLFQTSDPQNLYIIALGINDVYSILPDNPNYIGSSSDIGTDNNTLWNNITRIVDAIRNKDNRKSKMIIMGIPNRTDDSTYWQGLIDMENNALVQISNYHGIPFVSLAHSDYFNSDFYKEQMVGGHPTAIGYSCIANEIQNLIEQCLKKYADKFIGYPYE